MDNHNENTKQSQEGPEVIPVEIHITPENFPSFFVAQTGFQEIVTHAAKRFVDELPLPESHKGQFFKVVAGALFQDAAIRFQQNAYTCTHNLHPNVSFESVMEREDGSREPLLPVKPDSGQ